jgi:hypothetical protein
MNHDVMPRRERNSRATLSDCSTRVVMIGAR